MIRNGLFPKLTSSRLFLRQLKESDVKSIIFLRSNPQVNKWVSRPQARDRVQALEFMDRIHSFFNFEKGIYWCISIKDSEEMIGSICLWNFSEDREIAEIGYDLKPDFQGRGIMDEAMKNVLNYGFQNIGFKQIEAFTHKNNKPSKSLFIRNGFRLNPERKDEDNLTNQIFELRNLYHD